MASRMKGHPGLVEAEVLPVTDRSTGDALTESLAQHPLSTGLSPVPSAARTGVIGVSMSS